MATRNSYTDDMPTPDRTSLPEIVAAGAELLESEGLAAVTMAAVAARVGVRPPSLYKRVRSRDELVGLIAAGAVEDLRSRLASGEPDDVDPRARLERLAVALRGFAHARPAAYRLVFSPGELRLESEQLASAAAPLFDVVGELAGPDHALEAARTVTAWATGFIAMELGGAFRMGGDVDAAFAYGVDRLATAITAG